MKSGVKQGKHQEKTAVNKRVLPSRPTDGFTAVPAPQLPALANYPTTRPQRQAQVLQMQKQQGNRSVQRTLAHLQRTDGEEEAAAAPRVLNAGGINIHEQVPGYGLIPTLQRAPTPAKPAEKVKSHVKLKSNSPQMQALPAAAIGAAHGRPDAVGWTTPQWDVAVSYADEQNVHVAVTLDFRVELPIDYDADAAAVVIDHELGHVRIAERKAQTHMVDEVNAEFQKLDKVESESQIQTILNGASAKLKEAEKQASTQYDNTDYARMVEAYQGVRKSLAELASKSAAIAQVADSLRSVNNRLLLSLRSYDFGTIQSLADAAIAARGGLSAQELARLQYNKEFKGLVGTCQSRIQATRQTDLMLGVDPENIPDDVKAKLTALEGTLGGFTFSPTGATAGY
ncbi:MAG: hypothetical protein V9G20_26055 [Candidatus Promineifilaceae bacterium]